MRRQGGAAGPPIAASLSRLSLLPYAKSRLRLWAAVQALQLLAADGADLLRGLRARRRGHSVWIGDERIWPPRVWHSLQRGGRRGNAFDGQSTFRADQRPRLES